MNHLNCSPDICSAFVKITRSDLSRKPFIISGQTTTYADVSRQMKKLTWLYAENGLVPGDRVIVAGRNDSFVSVIFLSLLRNGLTAVIIDPDTKLQRAKHLIGVAKARGIIADKELLDSWQIDHFSFMLPIQERTVSLTQKLFRKQDTAPAQSYPDILHSLPNAEPRPDVDMESDAYILFTSGTTSEPKGVCITQKNLFSHLQTLSRQFHYQEESRILNVLILTHADGIIQGPVITFANAATLYRPCRFSIQNLDFLMNSIYKYRISHFVAVPTMLALILKLCRDQPDIFLTDKFKYLISTGAYLDAHLWQQFEELFQQRITNCYGLTETVTGGLFSGPDDDSHRIGTVGKPVDCSVRIVDDHGRDVKPGQSGELALQGDNVMHGYFNAPETTAKTIRDNWLYTGDIATCDEQGLYRIVGRKKAIIISGGINIHPEEITKVLYLNPKVADAVAFGVEDSTWGERIVAAVSLYPDNSSSEQELVDFCRLHLEAVKIPHEIHILPSLPKGHVGKVQIEEVKNLIQTAGSHKNSLAGRDNESKILELASSCFHVPVASLTLQTKPDHITGWDSLSHLEFVSALEQTFHIQLSAAEIIRIEKLDDASTIVRGKNQ